MKYIAILLLFLSTSAMAYTIPNLDDFVFKLEKGTLYYAEKSDYHLEHSSFIKFDNMSEDEIAKYLKEHATKVYNWKKAIPGPLMKELMRIDAFTGDYNGN